MATGGGCTAASVTGSPRTVATGGCAVAVFATGADAWRPCRACAIHLATAACSSR